MILSTTDTFAPERPAKTVVEIAVAASELLARFANDGVAQVEVHRDSHREVTVELAPTPTQLEVSLVKSDGSPSTGRTVTAEGNGHTVALPESSAGSHVYRSAPTMWDRTKQPYKIMVNGRKRAQAFPDYTSAVTRLRVVDS